MNLLIVDTNVLLRFLLDDVPEQADEVSRVFVKARAGDLRVFIPQIVVFEVVFNLVKLYEFDKDKVIDALNIIFNTQHFLIQDKDVFNLALALFKTNNISFADCFIAGYVTFKKGNLFTFDKVLKKLAKN